MKLLRWYYIILAFLAPIGLAVAADSFVSYNDPSGALVRFKAIDNGDGTFSWSVSGAITASNPSVGTNGSAAPASSTEQGCVAQNAESVVTNGQLAGTACDLAKKQIVLPYANPENFLDGTITTAMTGTTSTAVNGMGAQAAGVRNYVTACTVSNAHATIGTDVVLQDGSGGTTLWTLPAAPGYGGSHVTFPTPLKTTAATALFAANVTTGASTKLSCAGYKGA
jgi:hypothetical protein